MFTFVFSRQWYERAAECLFSVCFMMLWVTELRLEIEVTEGSAIAVSLTIIQTGTARTRAFARVVSTRLELESASRDGTAPTAQTLVRAR